MAKSYTIGRNLYGTFTKNTATANLSLGDHCQDDYRAICAVKLAILGTTSNTHYYCLNPVLQFTYDCDQVREIAVIVSSKDMCQNKRRRAFWDK